MKNLFCVVLSGILLSVSWPTYGVPFFIFVAFVPLLFVEENISGTEGGSGMFLLYVYEFGRIGGLLLRNRSERCGHSAGMGREVRFRLSAVGRHVFSDAVFFRRPLRPSERRLRVSDQLFSSFDS